MAQNDVVRNGRCGFLFVCFQCDYGHDCQVKVNMLNVVSRDNVVVHAAQ